MQTSSTQLHRIQVMPYYKVCVDMCDVLSKKQKTKTKLAKIMGFIFQPNTLKVNKYNAIIYNNLNKRSRMS